MASLGSMKSKEEAIAELSLPDLEQRLLAIRNGLNSAMYELGGLIRRVKDEKMWKYWGDDKVEFPSFHEWCWKVLGFKSRKAHT